MTPRARPSASVQATSAPERRRPGVDGGDGRRGDYGRAGRHRGVAQGARDGAHAAHRHVPVAGPVADDVVEKAAVLPQGRLVDVGEGADQAVGGRDPADDVVGEGTAQHLPEGLLEERAPGLLAHPVDHEVPDRRPREQGLGERRREPAGHLGGHGVEAAPRLEVGVRTGETPERGARGDVVLAVDQEAAVGHRGVRGPAAALQRDGQAELVDHAPGQERDEVGVAREPRVHPGEGPGRDGGAAHVVRTFEDEDGPAAAGRVGRRGEAVVTPAHDDDVVPGTHRIGHGRHGGMGHRLPRTFHHRSLCDLIVTFARGAGTVDLASPATGRSRSGRRTLSPDLGSQNRDRGGGTK